MGTGYYNNMIRRIPMAYCKADPTPAPTAAPTADPTASPTATPTISPTLTPPSPTTSPTSSPTVSPTLAPTVERGYILLKSGKYRRCDDGTQPDPNLEKCESCRSGFAGKNGRCEACKPNEVADVSSRECVAKVATPVWKEDWFWGATGVMIALVAASGGKLAHMSCTRHQKEMLKSSQNIETNTGTGTRNLAISKKNKKTII